MGRPKFIFDLFVKFWPLGNLASRLGNLPLLGRLLHLFFGREEHRSIVIPINEAVQGTESVVLPFSLLSPLIQGASFRFIMDHCMCRQGGHCEVFSRDIGCLFLGEGAAQINPVLGRLVHVDEAMAHVQRAMEARLVPLVVHSAFDSFVLGVPFRRMLGICFCCDCCCTVRQAMRLGPPIFGDTVLRLPGLTVTIGDSCVGCGTCLDLCHVQAISLKDGYAVIDERCKGCGRCAAACPTEAIELYLDTDVDVVERLVELVEERTEIGTMRGEK